MGTPVQNTDAKIADMWWLGLAIFLVCIIEVGIQSIVVSTSAHPTP